jgi:hypothetical protein
MCNVLTLCFTYKVNVWVMELYWKCIYNIFRVGTFWTHIRGSECKRICHACNVPETLEHIALHCDALGQDLIWRLTSQLWLKRYSCWPKLSWGLILRCNLMRFRTDKGRILPEKCRLLAILISVDWHLIWKLTKYMQPGESSMLYFSQLFGPSKWGTVSDTPIPCLKKKTQITVFCCKY